MTTNPYIHVRSHISCTRVEDQLCEYDFLLGWIFTFQRSKSAFEFAKSKPTQVPASLSMYCITWSLFVQSPTVNLLKQTKKNLKQKRTVNLPSPNFFCNNFSETAFGVNLIYIICNQLGINVSMRGYIQLQPPHTRVQTYHRTSFVFVNTRTVPYFQDNITLHQIYNLYTLVSLYTHALSELNTFD